MGSKTNTQTKLLPMAPAHISGVDGLRGIAVLGILMYHLFPGVVRGGFMGVVLLFVLSGYLIAVTSRNDWADGIYHAGTFYKKRIVRLYPPLILVISGTLVMLKAAAPGLLHGIQEEILSILLGYNNMWQIRQNASYFTRIANASPFTHLWALSIEMQFYLAWPFFFWIYRKLDRTRYRKYSAAPMMVLAVFSVLRLERLYGSAQELSAVYYDTGARSFALFMGAYLGLRKRRLCKYSRRRAKKKLLLFGGLFLCLMAGFAILGGQTAFTYRAGMVLMGVLSCWVLALAADSRLPFGKLLDIRLLVWIGRRGYEIYLWQYPVIFLFRRLKWNRMAFSPVLICTAVLLLAAAQQKMQKAFGKCVYKNKKLYARKHGRKRGIFDMKKVMAGMGILFCMAFALGGCGVLDTLETQAGAQEPETAETSAQQIQIEYPAVTVTAVGDSVLLGAASSLQEEIPGCVIDAKESRQVVQAGDVLEKLEEQGSLGQTVVIALGTNGSFNSSSGQELVDQLGSDREIYWVNVYGEYLDWQEDSNAAIEIVAEDNDNVHIIDWASEAAAHPEYLYEDGIHLNETGQDAYAKLIASSLQGI